MIGPSAGRPRWSGLGRLLRVLLTRRQRRGHPRRSPGRRLGNSARPAVPPGALVLVRELRVPRSLTARASRSPRALVMLSRKSSWWAPGPTDLAACAIPLTPSAVLITTNSMVLLTFRRPIRVMVRHDHQLRGMVSPWLTCLKKQRSRGPALNCSRVEAALPWRSTKQASARSCSTSSTTAPARHSSRVRERPSVSTA